MTIKVLISKILFYSGIMKSMRMRIPSSKVFRVISDTGAIEVLKPIRMGNVALRNISLSGSVKVAGVPLSSLIDKVLEVEEEGDTYVIKAYYE